MDTDPATQSATARRTGDALPGPRSFFRAWATWFAWSLALIAMIGGTFAYQTHRRWKDDMLEEFTRNLTQKAKMLAARLDSDRGHSIDVIASQEGQAAGARATVVDSNGRVLADSEITVSSLENEGRQPEFVAARRGLVGIETRRRNQISVLYVAVPVSGGAVRLASPLSDLESASERDQRSLMLSCLGAACLAFVVCLTGAAVITRRKNRVQ